MIEIGCCALSFVGLGNEESLGLIRGMGFKYADVEVISSKAQVNQLEAAAEPERVGTALHELAASLELSLAEFFVVDIEIDGQPVTPSHPETAVRERALEQFRRLCCCAQASGCRSIMLVPGSPRQGADFEAEWDTSVATLRRLVAVARDHGLSLNVEPHSGSIATSPELAARLPRDVEGLTYVLDYAHFVSQNFAQEEVYPLHEFTNHMHAKPCGLGLGKIPVHLMTLDLVPIIADLAAQDWEGIISCECIWPVDAPDLTRHPAVQNALMAHRLEQAIHSVSGGSDA